MASQRRAPTKRPPRPAAKTPPPSDASEGKDAVESAKRRTRAAAPPRPAAPAAGPSSPPAAAKTAPAPPGPPRPKPSGPNYRPPTGVARSASRRPPPPPRKKKPLVTKRTVGALIALALIGSLVVFFSVAVNGSSSSPTVNAALAGPEQVEVPKGSPLAAVDTARYPATIDGISCQTSEQVVYHIHAHLTIFVNGQPRQVPYGVGIGPPLQYNTTNGTFVNGGSCFYWLHTHAADGILHIESPTQTTYTLGQFFDVWGQPLKAGQVGPAVGTMKAYVDGKPYTGDPRAITLGAHSQIQLDIGTPAPAPTSISFPSGL